MIQFTYIYHDCFLVQLPECNIVFDFWKDPLFPNESLPGFLQKLDRQKPLYVIVSHHHKDHYTKKIFEWVSYFSHIKYIISKDVAKMARHILTTGSIYSGTKPRADQVSIISPGEMYDDALIAVEAFRSTDIGNSYFVEIKQGGENNPISIFHAGDLNAWLWKDESTKEEVEHALKSYLDVLDSIRSRHSKIDFVMFPVDSRIGTDFAEGARLFVREIDVKHFFPMHFGLYDTPEEEIRRRIDAADLRGYANLQRGEYICLQAPYSAYLTH